MKITCPNCGYRTRKPMCPHCGHPVIPCHWRDIANWSAFALVVSVIVLLILSISGRRLLGP